MDRGHQPHAWLGKGPFAFEETRSGCQLRTIVAGGRRFGAGGGATGVLDTRVDGRRRWFRRSLGHGRGGNDDRRQSEDRVRFRHLCRVVEWWKVSLGSFSSCFCVVQEV